jgi:hypothetical protein
MLNFDLTSQCQILSQEIAQSAKNLQQFTSAKRFSD